MKQKSGDFLNLALTFVISSMNCGTELDMMCQLSVTTKDL
ncbi:hypothetical protein VCHA28FP16_30232 [Vibrio chagasii]|nr:hypothetical protein VCHA28FP16_30232 [Vibrio chagasii]